MKKTTRTSRSAGYLEKMFRQLNADSFGGELEEPIITIQTTPGTYGHVTVGKTWKQGKDGEWRHELNISADWLNRPIENVVSTMIHEMVHLYNIAHGVQDCSRGGSYHNKKFRDEAEKHMIHIEKDEKYGWTVTHPTEELIDYIIAQGWEEFQMCRGFGWIPTGGSGAKAGNGGQGLTKPPKGTQKPKGSNSRRYVCPSCGAIVRTTTDLEIICKPCGLDFELT